jgi:hypothetical protein
VPAPDKCAAAAMLAKQALTGASGTPSTADSTADSRTWLLGLPQLSGQILAEEFSKAGKQLRHWRVSHSLCCHRVHSSGFSQDTARQT